MTDTLEPAGTLFRNDGQASETELAAKAYEFENPSFMADTIRTDFV